MKVSWQVTGIRHDPWAQANRIPVEVDKPAEQRGSLLHPDVGWDCRGGSPSRGKGGGFRFGPPVGGPGMLRRRALKSWEVAVSGVTISRCSGHLH